ncbi:uncharacterized protein AMSG_07419 [Thecamonas trahens ATCC 50062]|uniref:Strictosidine synthase conserved region domain-containing protein n=1 Tax=Thecamonas trahens ATCC 50062 TaxID=461836 RepID=A0A0L0DGR8_THETB|nr:hypothetical protein AMSG_07419 [Thecamonas trahens ATCC 50062]KNC51522.1 hypothetical protein AMSG_07419 [Thecamonas trahens ATCC 50062]|eukprot:XP_013755925.1 hypothetical protein AMSG_07419 [Thecamonas trahens ATCC 50062]
MASIDAAGIAEIRVEAKPEAEAAKEILPELDAADDGAAATWLLHDDAGWSDRRFVANTEPQSLVWLGESRITALEAMGDGRMWAVRKAAVAVSLLHTRAIRPGQAVPASSAVIDVHAALAAPVALTYVRAYGKYPAELYVVDASWKYRPRNIDDARVPEELEMRGHGRVLAYDPQQRVSRWAIARELYFPLGVAAADDGAYVLVTEATKARIKVIDRSDDERWSVFVDGLPCEPGAISPAPPAADGSPQWYVGCVGVRGGWLSRTLATSRLAKYLALAVPTTMLDAAREWVDGFRAARFLVVRIADKSQGRIRGAVVEVHSVPAEAGRGLAASTRSGVCAMRADAACG